MRRRRVIMFSFRPSVIRRAALLLAVVVALALLREAAIRTTAPLTEFVSGRVVVIDPGHGGLDPGCVAGEAVEKEIVLEIAKRLAVRFDRAFMHATLTRESDTDLADSGLEGLRARKRQDIIRRAEAAKSGAVDLLISVHANSFPSPVWSGAQTFYYPKREESRRLAVQMQNALVGRLGPNVRREKEGDFLLLERSGAPAVLVEVGFLSNPREALLLREPAYQEKVAGALFAGAVQYLALKHTGQVPTEIAANHRGYPATIEWRERWRAVRRRSKEEVVLYYLGPTNREDYLVPELRRVEGFGRLSENDQVRAALRELAAGPGPGSALVSALPGGLTVEGVAVSGREVRVCLNATLAGLGLGERGEELALYALVNTVAEIIPGAVIQLVLPNGEPAQGEAIASTGVLTARPDLLCPGRE